MSTISRPSGMRFDAADDVAVAVADGHDLHAVPAVDDGARAAAAKLLHLDVVGAVEQTVAFVRHDGLDRDVPAAEIDDDAAAAALDHVVDRRHQPSIAAADVVRRSSPLAARPVAGAIASCNCSQRAARAARGRGSASSLSPCASSCCSTVDSSFCGRRVSLACAALGRLLGLLALLAVAAAMPCCGAAGSGCMAPSVAREAALSLIRRGRLARAGAGGSPLAPAPAAGSIWSVAGGGSSGSWRWLWRRLLWREAAARRLRAAEAAAPPELAAARRPQALGAGSLPRPAEVRPRAPLRLRFGRR